LEICDGISRHEFNAKVSLRDMRDTFFPVFRAAIIEGEAHGVMCSYNAVNSTPSCANPWLLQDVLRDEWGFAGHVVSDCGAIVDVYAYHLYSPTQEEAAGVSLRAGTDLDCGSGYTALNASSISRGIITEEDLDLAMSRLFHARMRLGEFDPISLNPYRSIPPTVIDSAKHRTLARQLARESIVLLKNEGMYVRM